MKRTVTLILASSVWVVGCNIHNSQDQSITVKKDDFKYQFTAEFPERKTAKVFTYIKKTLKEDNLFRNPKDFKDTQVNLGDSVRFHLSAEPGYVKISFRKRDNSVRSAIKLEEMCAGIKETLR